MHLSATKENQRAILIWDLPVRLFHWVLVVQVVFSIITAKIGGNLMVWHVRSGYAILALLVFRILWGFMGGQTARFAAFVHRPGRVIGYARHLLQPADQPHAGHNPLGGWMVVLMLGLLVTQAVSGLFADDEIATTGPLAAHASARIVGWMSKLHALNSNALLILVALHIFAILAYLLVKKDNLIRPMLTGKKWLPDGISEPRMVTHWLALACFAMGVGLVAALVLFV
jgi:cytochrome b